jgi:hypothetical protein
VVEQAGPSSKISDSHLPSDHLGFRPDTLLTDGFPGFCRSLQENPGIKPQIRPRPFPPTSISVHYKQKH